MNQKHEDAFKLNLSYFNGIKVAKKGNQILVGFVDKYLNLDGVGVKIRIDEGTFDQF